jgi:acetyl esterase
MPLDPQARTFLDEFAAAGIPMPWEVETAARAREVLAGLQLPPEEPIAVARVEDHVAETAVGSVPYRLFIPEGAGPFPVLMWFHGGGWTVGSLDESETTCRSLCRRVGAIVVCPDYRLAPEYPFPAAHEDCYAITAWVADRAAMLGADGCVAVGGDSAGGNLAAGVALMARDRGRPQLAFQLLVYPVVGLPTDGRQSYDKFAEGYFLTREGMEWFTNQYFPNGSREAEPLLAPLHATDLSGLPPALVITAEYDPLRDEGEEYARRLADSGVAAASTRYDGQIHAFFVLTDQFDSAFVAHDQAAAALTRAFTAARRHITTLSDALAQPG